ncbi:MAG: hypothetical protein ABNO60_00885 [Candidatus Shikimatogenerans sp. Tcar]|uniref:Translation elongation factor EFTs/EF1B dimerisation domain-containing protein n=1 Tax=Candidatus Shikimatogenerans sp. Tcar TaxID=3158565 RepID=A0AAU7QUV5_9FLAO
MCKLNDFDFIYSFIKDNNVYMYNMITKTDFTIDNKYFKKLVYLILKKNSSNKYLLNINNIIYIKKYNLIRLFNLSKIFKEYFYIKKYDLLSTNNKKIKIYNYNHFNFRNSVITKMYFPNKIDNYEMVIRNITIHIAAFNPKFINISNKKIFTKEELLLMYNNILLYQKFLRDTNVNIHEYLCNVDKYIRILEYKNYFI